MERCRKIVRRSVASTRGTDPGRGFVGGPYPGDIGNVGILIPTAPTVSQYTRYLARLCAVEVPKGHKGRVTSIRQLATLIAKIPIVGEVRQEQGSCTAFTPAIFLEKQIKSPFFSLPDGNIVWFLRAVPIVKQTGTMAAAFADGYSRNPYGLDSAIIALNIAAPYTPPDRGVPPGDEMSEYGIWYDMRFPWYTHTTNTHALNLEVEGPCAIIMYASIWQGDPTTRPRPDNGLGPEQFMTDDGSESEDKFWIAYPCTRYHRIGGEITVEIERSSVCKCSVCKKTECGCNKSV
jgi:hypothetical protein